MKKFVAVIICLLMCLLLFGCKADIEGNENIEELTNKDGQVALAVTDDNGEIVYDENGDYVTELAVLVTDENNEPVKNELGQYIVEKENGEQVAVGEPTGTTAPAQSDASTSASEKNSTSNQESPTKTTEKTTTTTTKKQTTTTTTKKQTTTTTTTAPTTKGNITVTITIVDGDNTILSSYPITAKKGTGLSHLVQAACDANGIEAKIESSKFGGTIVNKIGDTEASWYYTINGGSEAYNFKEQNLKNNDSVYISHK